MKNFLLTAVLSIFFLPAFSQVTGLRYDNAQMSVVKQARFDYPFWKPTDFKPEYYQPTMPVVMAASILQAYRTQNLPMFCRIESNLEKSSGLPIKMRLGSVDYVDMLERKRAWTGQ